MNGESHGERSRAADGGAPDRASVLGSVLADLRAGRHGDLEERVVPEQADRLPTAWAELTDTFGPVESVGTPEATDDGARALLELEAGEFEAVAEFGDGTPPKVTQLRIRPAGGGRLAGLRLLAARLWSRIRRAIPGLSTGSLPAGDRTEQARAVVELLEEGRYGDVYDAMDPTVGAALDREEFARTTGDLYEGKVGRAGTVAIDYDPDEDRAYVVPEGTPGTWIEVAFGQGPTLVGIQINDAETVAQLLASRVLRGGRTGDLREMWSDDDELPVASVESLAGTWESLTREYGEFGGVSNVAVDGGDPADPVDVDAAVDLGTETVTLRLRLDERRAVSRLAVLDGGETVWESGPSGDDPGANP